MIYVLIASIAKSIHDENCSVLLAKLRVDIERLLWIRQQQKHVQGKTEVSSITQEQGLVEIICVEQIKKIKCGFHDS